MRIIIGVLAIILTTSTVVPAQFQQMMGGLPGPTTRSEPKETLRGFLVDRSCALHATSTASLMQQAHSTDCMLKSHEPELGVVSNGKWVAFDEKGSKKAAELLKKSDERNTKVVVIGRTKGDKFAVSKIEYVKQ